ncbi:hypothetical protein JW887_03030 [Candidatus Dojkabacteria bacterium]|nr:hypothetical protein [Candidatus Dojkabacteria bacterium]
MLQINENVLNIGYERNPYTEGILPDFNPYVAEIFEAGDDLLQILPDLYTRFLRLSQNHLKGSICDNRLAKAFVVALIMLTLGTSCGSEPSGVSTSGPSVGPSPTATNIIPRESSIFTPTPTVPIRLTSTPRPTFTPCAGECPVSTVEPYNRVREEISTFVEPKVVDSPDFRIYYDAQDPASAGLLQSIQSASEQAVGFWKGSLALPLYPVEDDKLEIFLKKESGGNAVTMTDWTYSDAKDPNKPCARGGYIIVSTDYGQIPSESSQEWIATLLHEFIHKYFTSVLGNVTKVDDWADPQTYFCGSRPEIEESMARAMEVVYYLQQIPAQDFTEFAYNNNPSIRRHFVESVEWFTAQGNLDIQDKNYGLWGFYIWLSQTLQPEVDLQNAYANFVYNYVDKIRAKQVENANAYYLNGGQSIYVDADQVLIEMVRSSGNPFLADITTIEELVSYWYAGTISGSFYFPGAEIYRNASSANTSNVSFIPAGQVNTNLTLACGGYEKFGLIEFETPSNITIEYDPQLLQLVVTKLDGTTFLAPDDVSITDLSQVASLLWVGKTSDNVPCPLGISIR